MQQTEISISQTTKTQKTIVDHSPHAIGFCRFVYTTVSILLGVAQCKRPIWNSNNTVNPRTKKPNNAKSIEIYKNLNDDSEYLNVIMKYLCNFLPCIA